MKRTMNKGLRDTFVIAIGSVLVAISENTIELGLPVEFTPVVSALALVLYRIIRDRFIGAPSI